MAELLVRVVDKVNTDSIYLDAQCTKRGDVIVVCPDGWTWGKEELSNPDWRIVKIPGMTVSEASVFLGSELDLDPRHPSRTLQRRAFKLDVDAATMPRGYLNDSTRAQPATVLTRVVVLTAQVTKARIPDPAAIGESRNIF